MGEVIGTVLMLVATVGLVVGVIGFFRPVRFARVTDKRTAAIVVGISPGVGMMGGALAPDVPVADTAQQASTTALSPPVEGEASVEDSEPSATTATTTSASTTTAATTTSEPTTTTMAPIPSYEVIAEEDVSSQAVRIRVRVTVESGTDRDGLRKVASELVERYRSSHEYQALVIFFYHYIALANDVATLGVWEDAPYGDWGRAADVERGDYSQHEATDRTKEKDWTLLSSPQQIALFSAYNDTFDEMDEASDSLPSDDDVIAVVAANRGLTPTEVEEALDAVFDWMFNDL